MQKLLFHIASHWVTPLLWTLSFKESLWLSHRSWGCRMVGNDGPVAASSQLYGGCLHPQGKSGSFFWFALYRLGQIWQPWHREVN